MENKLSLRDFTVYSINGLVLIICLTLSFRINIFEFIVNNEFKNKELLVLVAIPFFYLIGQILFSIDNFLFKVVFDRLFFSPWSSLNRKKKLRIIELKRLSRLKRKYGWLMKIIYGYREKGMMRNKKIMKNRDRKPLNINSFLTYCARLRNLKRFEKADRYDMLTDANTGLVLIFFITSIITLFRNDWLLLLVSIILLVLFYFRAKQYAKYYVQEVVRQIKLIDIDRKEKD